MQKRLAYILLTIVFVGVLVFAVVQFMDGVQVAQDALQSQVGYHE